MDGHVEQPPSTGRAVDRDRAHAVATHELRHDAAETADLVHSLQEELSELDLSARPAELLRHLEVAATRLRRSVDRLLDDPDDLHRLNLAPVRVADVVQRVVDAHDPRGHRVECDAASLIVQLDEVKLERIIDNLLLNALHHTPTGCRVRIRVTGRRGGGVQLVVEDDGPGLPAADIDQFLDPASPGGGGLGVVALLTQLHGGTAEAAPAGADGGLRVHVELPGGVPGRAQRP